MLKTVIKDFSESEMREIYYSVSQRYLDVKMGRYDSETSLWRYDLACTLRGIIEKIEQMGVEL
jgi:hypothetical protein